MSNPVNSFQRKTLEIELQTKKGNTPSIFWNDKFVNKYLVFVFGVCPRTIFTFYSSG